MFKFKEISSDEMNVIVEEELNFLRKSSIKYNVTEIPGQNGNNYEEIGYSNIEIPLKLQLLDSSKLDSVFSWLQGSGILEYKDKITTASFFMEAVPLRFGSIYTIELSCYREPFWYKKNDLFVVVEDTVTNEGNVYAEPLLRIEKTTSQKIDLTINEVRFTYDFREEEYVEIDCQSGNAFYNGLNRNLYLEMGFEVPILKIGINVVQKNNCECILKMKRKDRYL